MIGVKITVLMFVITAIYSFVVRGVASNEDPMIKMKMLSGIYPTYVKVGGILVIATIIGIMYSTIYLLFFI